MESILSQSAEARKMSLSLKHVAYSGELEGQMMAHSQSMEKIYATCQQLIANTEEPDDSSKFKKLVHKVESKFAWFEKAKVGIAQNSVLKHTVTDTELFLFKRQG